ncbi:TPA: hypothetical protein ACXEV6_005001, partial [Serratia marcescens]
QRYRLLPPSRWHPGLTRTQRRHATDDYGETVISRREYELLSFRLRYTAFTRCLTAPLFIIFVLLLIIIAPTVCYFRLLCNSLQHIEIPRHKNRIDQSGWVYPPRH